MENHLRPIAGECFLIVNFDTTLRIANPFFSQSKSQPRGKDDRRPASPNCRGVFFLITNFDSTLRNANPFFSLV